MLDVIDVYLRWIIWNVFIMKVYKQMDIPGNKKVTYKDHVYFHSS